jgi:tRNA (adenine22-N1)-methyltransferase
LWAVYPVIFAAIFRRVILAAASMNKQTTVKLRKRLGQLENMLDQRYSVIWDCCCDHGLLGMSLLHKKLADKVVFVDILAHQMALLEKDLSQRFPEDKFNWQVVCQDIKALAVPQTESQLFVIAGVGGDKTVEFIESLCAAMPGLPFDLLLCSVQGNYQVRKALIKQGFYMKQEQIVFENKRFYEAIYVGKNAGSVITTTGNSMWDWSNPDHQNYWQKIVGHYRKKALVDPLSFRSIVDEYESLLDSANIASADRSIFRESSKG